MEQWSGGGRFENHIVHDTNPGDCDSESNDFEQRYNLISIGYSTTKIINKLSKL